MIGKLKQWWVRPDAKVELIEQGQTQGRMEADLPRDTGWSIRVGMLILVLGFGGFMLWAVMAPLDEGVPAPGQVIVEGKRKTVQHLSGGMVHELLVQEAQQVKAGQVLLRLDDTVARANFDAALQTYYAMLALEARLSAEQIQAREIRFPEVLLHTQEALVPAREHMASQRQVFAARRAALEGELSVLAENLKASEALVNGLENQMSYLKPQLAGMRDLANEGYAPRNRQLEMERSLAELQSNAMRAQSAVAEMRLRALQRRMDFRKEVETQLSDTKRESANAAERVRAARLELERTVILAPSEGSVTGLMVHTLGGVITPGQKLMDIIPEGDGLILEVHVPAHLIDRVRAGMPADITFQSFVNLPSLSIDGRLISISADVIADPNPNMPPYYLAHIEVTAEGMKKLGSHQMQPGMPASVVIKTGSRSLLDYLMKPLMRRITTALTEA